MLLSFFQLNIIKCLVQQCNNNLQCKTSWLTNFGRIVFWEIDVTLEWFCVKLQPVQTAPQIWQLLQPDPIPVSGCGPSSLMDWAMFDFNDTTFYRVLYLPYRFHFSSLKITFSNFDL